MKLALILILQLNYSMEQCSICVEDISDRDEVRTTLCKHQFHRSCLNDWLEKNPQNQKCPNCRSLVNCHRELIEAVNLRNSKLSKKELVQLVEEGVDIDALDSDGYNALHHAVYLGKFDHVELLIGSRSNIDALDKYGWTSLMTAAWMGNNEMVKMLLKCGADISLKDREGMDASRLGSKKIQSIFEEFEKRLEKIPEKEKIKAEKKPKRIKFEFLQGRWFSSHDHEIRVEGNKCIFLESNKCKFLGTNELEIIEEEDNFVINNHRCAKNQSGSSGILWTHDTEFSIGWVRLEKLPFGTEQTRRENVSKFFTAINSVPFFCTKNPRAKFIAEKFIKEGLDVNYLIKTKQYGFTMNGLMNLLDYVKDEYCKLILSKAINRLQLCMLTEEEKTLERMGKIFVDAADSGDIFTVQELLKEGVNLNYLHPNSFTALLQAVIKGHASLVRVLLNYKAELNYSNTTLHLAAIYGNAKIKKMLLDEGANPFLSNIDGKFPLQCGANESCKQILEQEKVYDEKFLDMNEVNIYVPQVSWLEKEIFEDCQYN